MSRAAAPAADVNRRTWRCGTIALAVDSDDGDALQWIAEALEPWFPSTTEEPHWRIRITSTAQAFASCVSRYGGEGVRRPCFAFDQRVLSLPTWSSKDRVVIADAERSCFLTVGPGELEVLGDPRTRRWRMTSLWALHEIVATRLRSTHLELHAASVEAGGRALLLSGHKEAGKTTLSLHLLRSGFFRAIGNDRAFVGRAGAAFEVVGMPTVVRIRPPTVALFPELQRGLPPVERPYLHTIGELATAADVSRPDDQDLMLSAAQILRQLGVGAVGAAPLGAVVFPEVRAGADGWALERLAPNEVDASLWRNLYGNPLERDVGTIFTQIESSPTVPLRDVAASIAATVPGFRLVLGRGAYGGVELARRLAELARHA
jgi:hypothetical protein